VKRVAAARANGKSLRDIAAAEGAHHTQVMRDIKSSGGADAPPENKTDQGQESTNTTQPEEPNMQAAGPKAPARLRGRDGISRRRRVSATRK
jgi:hypothetical protein